MNTSFQFTMFDWMLLYPLFNILLGIMSLLSEKSEETFRPRLPLLQMPVANLEVPKAAFSSDQLATNAGISQTYFLRFDNSLKRLRTH